jgi:hypothetical protein
MMNDEIKPWFTIYRNRIGNWINAKPSYIILNGEIVVTTSSVVTNFTKSLAESIKFAKEQKEQYSKNDQNYKQFPIILVTEDGNQSGDLTDCSDVQLIELILKYS